MGQTRDDLKAEIGNLVADGGQIFSDEFAKLSEAPPKEKPKKSASEAKPKSQPFIRTYQLWYSRALKVVEQLLPDRYIEFCALYSVDRKGKEISVLNYGIADYLQTVRVTLRNEPVFNHKMVAAGRFFQQLMIVESAKDRLDSILADIKGLLEASLFDSELSAARDLLKAKHVRSAGIVAAVVLEGHLKRVVGNHKIPFRKTPTLSNLNQALKDADVIDVPQWRQLQHMTDIRNLCGHSGDRNPKPEEVQDLIQATEKVIRTLF